MWEEVVKGPSPSLPLGLRLILYDPHINNPLVLQPLVTRGIFHFYHSISLPIIFFIKYDPTPLELKFWFFLLVTLDWLVSCANWPWSYSMWRWRYKEGGDYCLHALNTWYTQPWSYWKRLRSPRLLFARSHLWLRWLQGGFDERAAVALCRHLLAFSRQCETMPTW